jgi:hypothetical protein
VVVGGTKTRKPVSVFFEFFLSNLRVEMVFGAIAKQEVKNHAGIT